MKRCVVILLLLLASCALQEAVQPQQPLPVVSLVPPIHAVPLRDVPAPILSMTPNEVVVSQGIKPFAFVSSNGALDSFGIVPAERYEALYSGDGVDVIARVFSFDARMLVDFVLQSDFYEIMLRGAARYGNSIVMVFLGWDNHRVVVWSSGTKLVYIDTSVADFAAREVVDAYLKKYPSDLVTPKCLDSDGSDHYTKGFTTNVQVTGRLMPWRDVCLRDFDGVKAGWYKSKKGVTAPDGLLEGMCSTAEFGPGFVDEYACAGGCVNGQCVLTESR